MGTSDEPTEMLADDFIGVVTFDASRPRIPAGNLPGGVEHVGCVVGNAIDQKFEAAFALLQPTQCSLEFACALADFFFQLKIELSERGGGVLSCGHIARNGKLANRAINQGY